MTNRNPAICREQQKIARLEKGMVLEKIKQRRADARRKIELGGLVIKAGMGGFNKAVILGALAHAAELITQDGHYLNLFQNIGENLFLEKNIHG